MVRSRSYVLVNQNQEELIEKGLEQFDCVANADDVHHYIADRIPAHWHRELEVFLLTSGSVRIGAGDRVHDLSAGEGCMINSGVLHSFAARSDAPCRFRSFVFDASILAGAPGSAFDTRYVRPFLAEGAAFIRFEKEKPAFVAPFEAAFAACASEENGYEFAVRDALSRILLLAEAQNSALSAPAPAQQEERIKRMLAWIDAHLEGEIRMDELARAAHVCPRVCQRLFRRYLHCRPMEYCMQRRILAAAWMLTATDAPITEIAMKYAFSSPSHFSHQFRQATGATPSEYRKRGGSGEMQSRKERPAPEKNR